MEKWTKKPARQAGGCASVRSRQRLRAKSKDLSPVPEPCDYFYDGEPEAPHTNLIMRPTGGRSEDRKEKFKENNYPFNIHPDHWKQIGRDMYASATTYSVIFGNSIHSIYDYCHEFKAADWWHWTHEFARIYLKDLLPKWYYEPYMLLLDAMDLATVGLSRRIILKSFVIILSHFYDITRLITRKISFHELLSGNLYFISYYMSRTVLLILAQCGHTGSFLVRDSAVRLFLLSGQGQNQTETYPLMLNVKNLEAIFDTQCSPPSWI